MIHEMDYLNEYTQGVWEYPRFRHMVENLSGGML
jgi:hypothetical protein